VCRQWARRRCSPICSTPSSLQPSGSASTNICNKKQAFQQLFFDKVTCYQSTARQLKLQKKLQEHVGILRFLSALYHHKPLKSDDYDSRIKFILKNPFVSNRACHKVKSFWNKLP
jgi:hypothetical protein